MVCTWTNELQLAVETRQLYTDLSFFADAKLVSDLPEYDDIC